MLTLKQVNKALKAAGHEAELIQDKDNLYFVSEEAEMWYSASVSVYRLNHIPDVAWWVREYERLKEQNKDRLIGD